VAPFHLGDGAALAGVYLRHRVSEDADLFVHERRSMPGDGGDGSSGSAITVA
jgi:hypothetical protein